MSDGQGCISERSFAGTVIGWRVVRERDVRKAGVQICTLVPRDGSNTNGGGNRRLLQRLFASNAGFEKPGKGLYFCGSVNVAVGYDPQVTVPFGKGGEKGLKRW